MESTDYATTVVKAEPSNVMNTTAVVPPPSHIHIYFHTHVSPDDSHSIQHNPSILLGAMPMGFHKGKHKKFKDNDADAEEVSRIDRFSLGPNEEGSKRGRDSSRGEQGSSQRY